MISKKVALVVVAANNGQRSGVARSGFKYLVAAPTSDQVKGQGRARCRNKPDILQDEVGTILVILLSGW